MTVAVTIARVRAVPVVARLRPQVVVLVVRVVLGHARPVAIHRGRVSPSVRGEVMVVAEGAAVLQTHGVAQHAQHAHHAGQLGGHCEGVCARGQAVGEGGGGGRRALHLKGAVGDGKGRTGRKVRGRAVAGPNSRHVPYVAHTVSAAAG